MNAFTCSYFSPLQIFIFLYFYSLHLNFEKCDVHVPSFIHYLKNKKWKAKRNGNMG